MTVEDLNTIVGRGTPLMVGGVSATVARLNMMEMVEISQIVVDALGPNVSKIKWGGSTSDEEVVQRAMTLLMMAGPEVVTKSLVFLRKIVSAVDPEQQPIVADTLRNPSPETFVDVLTAVVLQESEDMSRLVGKVKTMIPMVMQSMKNGL